MTPRDAPRISHGRGMTSANANTSLRGQQSRPAARSSLRKCRKDLRNTCQRWPPLRAVRDRFHRRTLVMTRQRSNSKRPQRGSTASATDGAAGIQKDCWHIALAGWKESANSLHCSECACTFWEGGREAFARKQSGVRARAPLPAEFPPFIEHMSPFSFVSLQDIPGRFPWMSRQDCKCHPAPQVR